MQRFMYNYEETGLGRVRIHGRTVRYFDSPTLLLSNENTTTWN